ncbi:MAG: two-component system, chemotaxis family, CheB/CheR fusion protein [Chloroflexota bacterium]|nr:two-component system, chemotaxis family, CheB/CheR fusion protein [Chloroflexota bacterium]
MSVTALDPAFEELLTVLYQTHHFDFSGYKRSTLVRRVRRRMDLLGLDAFVDYADYLEVHPEEFGPLFNTILINVTTFFRDPPAWEHVEREVIPRILAAKRDGEPIRVWSAGCASGEEAYTLAIILCEALGVDGFRERAKIYATDLDDDALERARHGTYTAKEIGAVPENLQARYFEERSGQWLFRNDLRRSVIFGRHDLVQDAPISRLDLLVSRNTLMYFTVESQARILARLHYALNDDNGFLFLGKAETLLAHSGLFAPVELKHRIFVKIPKVSARERLLLLAQAGSREAADHLDHLAHLRESAADAAPVAQLIVDVDGTVVQANEPARIMFGVTAKDVGRRLQDLEVSYRPVELRSQIENAHRERQPILLRSVERLLSGGAVQYLDVHVTGLVDDGGAILGTSVAFTDVTPHHQLQNQVTHAKQELETAYEELQSSNEELETTNEELQSTVEELETTNEELQSANEELETMNEELQSTNNELQAINTELRDRTEELDTMNLFMDSVLASVHVGVVVVDAETRVRIWNGRSEDLWGLRAREAVGEPFLGLDIGLPVDELSGAIRGCIAGSEGYGDVVLECVNRRGRHIRVRVTCTTLIGAGAARQGAILLMEEVPPEG